MACRLTPKLQAVHRQPVVFYYRVEEGFEDYAGGVYDDSCSVNLINHAMVLIGYDFNPSSGDRCVHTRAVIIRAPRLHSLAAAVSVHPPLALPGCTPTNLLPPPHRPVSCARHPPPSQVLVSQEQVIFLSSKDASKP